MPKARTFTEPEQHALRSAWPNERILVRDLCRHFGCSSKTLVAWVRFLGLPLRKPQRDWAA